MECGIKIDNIKHKQNINDSMILCFQAEDVLGCSHVVVCLGKPNSTKGSPYINNENINNQNLNTTNLEFEKESKMAIRNFLFLGFQPLAPGHEFNPSNPNLVSIDISKFMRLGLQFVQIIETITKCNYIHRYFHFRSASSIPSNRST